jgi:hypothetical protein
MSLLAPLFSLYSVKERGKKGGGVRSSKFNLIDTIAGKKVVVKIINFTKTLYS